MANVLIYSLVFPPDGVSTAQIMGELAADLASSGHTVSVVTTQPHYNRDEVALERQPLTRMWGGMLFRSTYVGIPVFHTKMPAGGRGAGIRSRMFGWLLFHSVGLAAAFRFARSADVILVPSPLLSAGVVAWLLGLVTGARYIYNVQELYPDLGIQLGRLRNPFVVGALRALERFIYRTAHGVTVITRGMESKLLSKGVARSKLHHIPNFVDVGELKALERTNAFSREHDLDERFVVSYAGNIGHAQGLDVLLDAAERLRHDTRIVFLFVGDGVARDGLIESARSRSLTNVKFVGHQPYARVPEIYSASDLCVVALLDTIASDAVPSKVYRIMACARPVLAIASAQSDLSRLVAETGAGVSVVPDASQLAHAIEQFAALGAAARDRHGEQGRSYTLEHVAREKVTAQYSQLVATLAARSRLP